MKCAPVAWLVVLFACNGIAWAQNAEQPFRGQPCGDRPESYWLEQAGLRLGMTLPDIEVVDENGKKFVTGQMRGRYTVLVFGCLT